MNFWSMYMCVCVRACIFVCVPTFFNEYDVLLRMCMKICIELKEKKKRKSSLQSLIVRRSLRGHLNSQK